MADYFADAVSVREEGNLPDSIQEEKLNPHIIKASIEIKKMISTETYDAHKGNENSDEFKELKIAESNLAISYAVHSLNIETEGEGIVRNKGWDESRSELLSQNELEMLSDHYRKIAMDILQPYLTPYTGDPDTEEDDDDVFRGGNISLIAT